MSRHRRIIIELSLYILRVAGARSGKDKVGITEVRFALNCLIEHCPEGWPLDMF